MEGERDGLGEGMLEEEEEEEEEEEGEEGEEVRRVASSEDSDSDF